MFANTPPSRYLCPQLFRQHILLVFLAPFGAGVFALLAIYDGFFLQNLAIAVIPALLSLSFFSAWAYYQAKKDLKTSTGIIVLATSLVLIAFVYSNQNESFGLVWALLYPPFIVMTMGQRWGLRLAISLYLVLVIIIFQGVGTWQQGAWDMTSLIRFSLSYIAMTYMTYVLALSNQLSYGILENEHRAFLSKHEKIKQLANIDATTGVNSRAYLKESIENLPLQELNKQNTTMLFFIVQIDWFQNYVDYYGYEKGDKLLKQISEIIRNQVLPLNGNVYRVTGSQFSGLVLTKNITKALCLIKEIQERVNQAHITNAMSVSQSVHVSIGITINHDFLTFDFKDIFKKTDEALYQSFENKNGEPFIIDLRNANDTLEKAG